MKDLKFYLLSPVIFLGLAFIILGCVLISIKDKLYDQPQPQH